MLEMKAGNLSLGVKWCKANVQNITCCHFCGIDVVVLMDLMYSSCLCDIFAVHVLLTVGLLRKIQ